MKSKLQYLLTAILFVLLMSAKAQSSYNVVVYVGGHPIADGNTAWVTSKYQTVTVAVYPNDSGKVYQFALTNSVGGSVPASGDNRLWSTFLYKGKYTITSNMGWSQTFYIKKLGK